jgi:hypothetical protein
MIMVQGHSKQKVNEVPELNTKLNLMVHFCNPRNMGGIVRKIMV